MLIELCCQNMNDALLAEHYGLRRIELNSGLEIGGLSPSCAMVKEIKARTKLSVIAMLRLRAGNFCYSEDEMNLMDYTAHQLLQSGADGLAFGAMTEDHKIDVKQTKRILNICQTYGKDFVFHRAFDTQNDMNEIEKLVAIGANRLLTSGMQSTAWEGRENLLKLQEKYGKYIEILAGAGVNENNILALYKHTSVTQLHGSFSKMMPSFSLSNVNFGHYLATDEEKLKKVAQIMQSFIDNHSHIQ